MTCVPESGPVEAAPMLNLEVDEQPENHHNDRRRQDLFLIHEGWWTSVISLPECVRFDQRDAVSGPLETAAPPAGDWVRPVPPALVLLTPEPAEALC